MFFFFLQEQWTAGFEPAPKVRLLTFLLILLLIISNLYSKSERELQGSGISVAPPERSRTVSHHPNPSAAGRQQRSDIKDTKDEDDKDNDKDNDEDAENNKADNDDNDNRGKNNDKNNDTDKNKNENNNDEANKHEANKHKDEDNEDNENENREDEDDNENENNNEDETTASPAVPLALNVTAGASPARSINTAPPAVPLALDITAGASPARSINTAPPAVPLTLDVMAGPPTAHSTTTGVSLGIFFFKSFWNCLLTFLFTDNQGFFFSFYYFLLVKHWLSLVIDTQGISFSISCQLFFERNWL